MLSLCWTEGGEGGKREGEREGARAAGEGGDYLEDCDCQDRGGKHT